MMRGWILAAALMATGCAESFAVHEYSEEAHLEACASYCQHVISCGWLWGEDDCLDRCEASADCAPFAQCVSEVSCGDLDKVYNADDLGGGYYAPALCAVENEQAEACPLGR